MMKSESSDINILIVDSTLRDGEQAPGVVFSSETKIALATALDAIGTDELEVGIPAMGESAQEEIRAIAALGLRSWLSTWCRATAADIEAAARCGIDGINISFPLSDILLRSFHKDMDWVWTTARKILPMARRWFARVSVGIQDATRTDPDKLVRFAKMAAGHGIERLRIADTVGIARPSTVDAIIRALRSEAPDIDIEFHAHNDLGMATANAVSAIEAGVSAVSVTVNGLGERAGNAALEEVAVAIAMMPGFSSNIRLQGLTSLGHRVAEASGRPIPAAKPVIGPAIFSHESGIHCAALLNDPLSYQAFLPQTVGHGDPKMIIGAHTGSSAIRAVLEKEHIRIDENMLYDFVTVVRNEVIKRRHPLSGPEVSSLYRSGFQSGI